MQNLELKARIPNVKSLENLKSLSIDESYDLYHHDIYFNSNYGRLKLRIINKNTYELISYSRQDMPNAKHSTYEIYTPEEPDKLLDILTSTIGIKVTVEKHRKAFIYKNCRIHIDEITDLGEFIEFEVVMIPGRTEQEANELMQFLIKHFEITDADLVKGSYSDLLLSI